MNHFHHTLSPFEDGDTREHLHHEFVKNFLKLNIFERYEKEKRGKEGKHSYYQLLYRPSWLPKLVLTHHHYTNAGMD